jgi:predicted nucleic acid-binding protein
MNVVLDTSVVVAAARSRRGASSLLIQWLADRRFEIVISYRVILEYEKAPRREARVDGWSIEDVTRFVDFMCAVGEPCDPPFLLRPVLADPDDEFVLELAFAGGVDYLVTHNVRDFAGSESFGIRVITPGELVRMIKAAS